MSLNSFVVIIIIFGLSNKCNTLSEQKQKNYEIDDAEINKYLDVNASIQDYKLIKLIGKGGMGSLYKAKTLNNSTVETVAIKVMQLETFKIDEIVAMKNLNNLSPMISPRYYNAFKDNNNTFYIAMEYMDKYLTIFDFFRYVKPLSYRMKETIARHLAALSINYLKKMHEKTIYHRDLSMANLMISKNDLRIIDFGCSVQGNVRNKTCATFSIKPPKYQNFLHLENTDYLKISDYWAVAVHTYYYYVHNYPFGYGIKALRNLKLFKSNSTSFLKSFKLNLQKNGASPLAVLFVLDMFTLSPTKRLSIVNSISSHPWFKKFTYNKKNALFTFEAIDIDTIHHKQVPWKTQVKKILLLKNKSKKKDLNDIYNVS